MKLPNGDLAVVDIRKLREYCLSASHVRGRHKARVFLSVLGITAEHAEDLRQSLLEAARKSSARPLETDEHGRRYVIESQVEGPSGKGRVRSLWIVRSDEDFPRFLTCYVARGRNK